MVTNPLESIHNCIAFDVMDWSQNKRHAWMYGIVCGWDEPAYTTLMSIHGWSYNEVSRNKELHKNYMILQERFEEMEKESGILC